MVLLDLESCNNPLKQFCTSDCLLKYVGYEDPPPGHIGTLSSFVYRAATIFDDASTLFELI
jgi:hypothetical protein